MLEAIRRAWARHVARIEEQKRLEEMAAARYKAMVRCLRAMDKQIRTQNR